MQFVSNKKWFIRRFSKRSRSIKLGYKNLYVFPNKFGFYWIFSLILLFILGTNLEANLTIVISYLMSVILVVNLFLAHFNLHGLEIFAEPQEINFAESPIKYNLIFKSKILRNKILLKFIQDNSPPLIIQKIEGEMCRSINAREKLRGVYYPEIIYGKSSAPMSLFNCWFYWKPEEKIIVAPKSIPPINKSSETSKSQGKSTSKNGIGDEFSYLKNYRKGESKSSIDWKSFSKTNKLSTKEFMNSNSHIKLLKLNINYPIEKSLQFLCFEIRKEYKNGNFYSVDMQNGLFMKEGIGYKHYRSCLITLANFKK